MNTVSNSTRKSTRTHPPPAVIGPGKQGGAQPRAFPAAGRRIRQADAVLPARRTFSFLSLAANHPVALLDLLRVLDSVLSGLLPLPLPLPLGLSIICRWRGKPSAFHFISFLFFSFHSIHGLLDGQTCSLSRRPNRVRNDPSGCLKTGLLAS